MTINTADNTALGESMINSSLHSTASSMTIMFHASSPDGSDYDAIVPMVLTFDRDTSNFTISIDIIDDLIHELNEEFFGRLTTSDEDVVILNPQQTRVRIADNDGMPQV